MKVIKNVYVAQTIIKVFLPFGILTTNSFVLNFFLEKLQIKIDIYAQKAYCFVFVENTIQAVNLDKFSRGALKLTWCNKSMQMQILTEPGFKKLWATLLEMMVE